MDITKINSERLAELLQRQLKEKGITVAALSEELNISQLSLNRFLRGGIKPSHKMMRKFVEHLDIPESELPRLEAEHIKPKGKHVFVSYSHRDKEYLDRLLIHLKPLERKGLIDPWVDTRLLAGDRWKKEIDKALKQARVAILLVSADFLASDFIIENELPPLLHAAEETGTLIIPVILKPCRFARDKSLSDFQATNSPDEPLSIVDDSERENVWDTIAQRIEQAFE